MIEIRCSGKRIDNGEDVYGYYFKDSDNHCWILDGYEYESDAPCSCEFIRKYEVSPTSVKILLVKEDDW